MTRSGERFLGNCESFELGIEDETREKYSSAEATSPLIKTVNVRRTPNLKIVLDEFDQDNLALAFMGSTADYIVTGASVVDEVPPTAVVKKGYWFVVGAVPATAPRRSLTAVSVKHTSGAPTYVAGTDYILDAVAGRIFIISAGAITDAQSLKVSYTYATFAAGALPTVKAGDSSFIEGFVRFVGKPASGATWEVEVWKASLSPDGVVPFIGDDFASLTLKGKLLADTSGHPTEPYFRAYKLS
jgi:hypothetical protein